MRDEKCCLSYWYTLVEKSGVPMPKTTIIKTDCLLWELTCGKKPAGYDAFMSKLRAACKATGAVVFLRTGQTSAKHGWLDTCYLDDLSKLAQHVYELCEFSEMVDMIGLPTKVWCVREFIPMESSFTAFKGFPVSRERRYFVRDGEIICSHSYWPHDAVKGHNPSDKNWAQLLNELNTDKIGDIELLRESAIKVSKCLPGAWSVDFAKAKNGTWYMIDAAEAHRSYHWEGCEKAKLFEVAS